jgi:hypothetical protein
MSDRSRERAFFRENFGSSMTRCRRTDRTEATFSQNWVIEIASGGFVSSST